MESAAVDVPLVLIKFELRRNTGCRSECSGCSEVALSTLDQEPSKYLQYLSQLYCTSSSFGNSIFSFSYYPSIIHTHIMTTQSSLQVAQILADLNDLQNTVRSFIPSRSPHTPSLRPTIPTFTAPPLHLMSPSALILIPILTRTPPQQRPSFPPTKRSPPNSNDDAPNPRSSPIHHDSTSSADVS